MVPGLEQIMKRGGQIGLKEIVLGMAHRGRLNVLANVMGKPFAAIFAEFQGSPAHPEDVQGSGDVKYHLGTSSDRDFDGNVIHLSLTANPSHLEAVNPVVAGKGPRQAGPARRPGARRGAAGAAARRRGLRRPGRGGRDPDDLGTQGLPGRRHDPLRDQQPDRLHHGAELFPLGSLSNRQSPCRSRRPIFHVNGDDPEAVVHVCRVAIEFRQRFHKDVVVDMFCYRRYGHNEGDEPGSPSR